MNTDFAVYSTIGFVWVGTAITIHNKVLTSCCTNSMQWPIYNDALFFFTCSSSDTCYYFDLCSVWYHGTGIGFG